MCKYNDISNIPAKLFFDILETKNYDLLEPNENEIAENIFTKIYDDYFVKSDNVEAKQFLLLTKEIAFLNYKIESLNTILIFLFYNELTKDILEDYCNAIKKGFDIEIDLSKPISEEIKRLLTEDLQWLKNELVLKTNELKSYSNLEAPIQQSYYDKIVNLCACAPPNFQIKPEITLLEFIQIEKAVSRYNLELQKHKK